MTETVRANSFTADFLAQLNANFAALDAATVSTLAELKALIYRPSVVSVSCKTTIGDGWGGAFAWVAGDTTTADDALVVQCTSGAAGRYKRVYDGSLNVLWFAADSTGVADSASAFTAVHAAAAARSAIIVPAGTYKLNSAVTATARVFLCDGCTFTGAGSLSGAVIANTSDAAPAAGSSLAYEMAISRGSINFVNEGGTWGGAVRIFDVRSRTFTSDDNNGGGGPNATSYFFAASDNCNADVVAILATALGKTNNTAVWGGNLIARNEGGTTGVKLVGLEIDVEPASGTTISSESGGLFLNIFEIEATGIPAIQLGSLGGGKWGNGIVLAEIIGAGISVSSVDLGMTSGVDLTNGTFSDVAIRLPDSVSGGIAFGSAATTRPRIFGDSGSNGVIRMGEGGFWVVQDSGGTQKFAFDSFGGLTLGAVKDSNGNTVLQLRKTGWALPTATLSRATFDPATVTTSELAERVAALITDCYSHHGMIGA